MIEYLKERNHWDDETHASVSWTAFAAARFTTIDPRFVPKHSHRHLPVGVKANRNDSKYTPACPAPECVELQETNDHFIMCSSPSRVAWRLKFQAALATELTRLLTDPPSKLTSLIRSPGSSPVASSPARARSMLWPRANSGSDGWASSEGFGVLSGKRPTS
jgi:hypothetical protein